MTLMIVGKTICFAVIEMKFMSMITQQRNEFIKTNGYKPLYLVLSTEMFMLLQYEVSQHFKTVKIGASKDEFTKELKNLFYGMTIVELKQTYGGDVKWAFGT